MSVAALANYIQLSGKNNDFTSHYDKALAIEPGATDASDTKRLLLMR